MADEPELRARFITPVSFTCVMDLMRDRNYDDVLGESRPEQGTTVFSQPVPRPNDRPFRQAWECVVLGYLADVQRTKRASRWGLPVRTTCWFIVSTQSDVVPTRWIDFRHRVPLARHKGEWTHCTKGAGTNRCITHQV